MSAADIKKWNQKYRDNPARVLSDPDPELIENQAILPNQRLALDLACGSGKNTLFLARLGLEVIAMDGAIEGLNQLTQFAADENLQGQVKCVQADLDDTALPVSEFDLVVVVRYLNRKLFRDIAASLKPGGILVYKTFNQNMLKRNPNFSAAYTIETHQLIESFSGLEVLKENLNDHESISAFLIARKPL